MLCISIEKGIRYATPRADTRLHRVESTILDGHVRTLEQEFTTPFSIPLASIGFGLKANIIGGPYISHFLDPTLPACPHFLAAIDVHGESGHYVCPLK